MIDEDGQEKNGQNELGCIGVIFTCSMKASDIITYFIIGSKK